MKKQDLKRHLGIYSIYKKRKTTINHAFASAISYFDDYNNAEIDKALYLLNQRPNSNLKCIYCNKSATTWDHLKCLVKNGAYTGNGHQLGNLVPCCKVCNSSKGSKDYLLFIEKLIIDDSNKENLKALLENYINAFNYKKIPVDDKNYLRLLGKYNSKKSEILKLMETADLIAAEIRESMKNNA